MKYTGQFKNIKNTLYQIDIDINDGNSTIKELTFSADPFVAEWNGTKNIYEPLKLSNATCSIVSKDFNFELYSTTPQKAKITLTNKVNNTVEFVGYLTPNLYNMGFENEYETIELEAIDGLSTLENYKYETIESAKKIKSFEDILLHIIKKCNCYNSIYLNLNLWRTGEEQENVLNNFFISEQNFFDSDGNQRTYKEVLFNLMQFLGYTIIAKGQIVYIVDYDYIKTSNTIYQTYSTSDNFNTYFIDYADLINLNEITETSFKANGGQIELSNVYNQVSVQTSVYKQDELIPQFFEDEFLTNIQYNQVGNWNASDLKVDANINKVFIYKYLKNEKWKNWYYNNETSWTEITKPNGVEYYDISTQIGSTLMRVANYDLTTNPSKLTYDEYICLHRHLKTIDDYPDNTYFIKNAYYPVLTLNSSNVIETSYLYDDYYLLINTSMLWTSAIGKAIIDDKTELKNDDENWNENNLKLLAKLKIGNKWWNGSNWTLNESTFFLYFSKGENTHLFNKWFEIKNNVTYADNINESGQKIPISKSDYLVGGVEFMLYTPVAFLPDFRLDCVFLKDLKIDLIKPNLNKDNDTDTEYKNVINQDFLIDNENKFEICSDTNKGINYSSVLIKNENLDFEFLENVGNKSLGTYQLQEKNFIEKNVNQFEIPKKILNLTLENIYEPYSFFLTDYFAGSTFVIDSMSIDYFNNTNLLTIIEKA